MSRYDCEKCGEYVKNNHSCPQEQLEQEIEELKKENEELKKENEELRDLCKIKDDQIRYLRTQI